MAIRHYMADSSAPFAFDLPVQSPTAPRLAHPQLIGSSGRLAIAVH